MRTIKQVPGWEQCMRGYCLHDADLVRALRQALERPRARELAVTARVVGELLDRELGILCPDPRKAFARDAGGEGNVALPRDAAEVRGHEQQQPDHQAEGREQHERGAVAIHEWHEPASS